MSETRAKIFEATPLVRGSVPLYKQLGHILRESIFSNQTPIGEMLPTEQILVDRYEVSRVTVRQALQDLATEGLIRRQRPKGSIVVHNRPRSGNGWNIDSLQDVVAFGAQTRVRIFSFSDSLAPPEIVKIFKLGLSLSQTLSG